MTRFVIANLANKDLRLFYLNVLSFDKLKLFEEMKTGSDFFYEGLNFIWGYQ
jgi:hypothetical protein